MALGEQELGVMLQASVDRAKEMLEEAGGFLPFGARAGRGGDVEFLEASGLGEGSVGDLYQEIVAMLGAEARRNDLLASALIGNTGLPDGAFEGFATAIAVLVEAPGFCRSVVVPYRLGAQGVELGRMIPEEADPIVFAIPAS